MSMDTTENIRRVMQSELNTNAPDRAVLEARYGKVWDASELSADFELLGFMAPMVAVKRKSDGAKGSLCFQHSPRFYFSFKSA